MSFYVSLCAYVSYVFKSREWDLNPRPADYESAALPLSYLGNFPFFPRLLYITQLRHYAF